MNAAEKDLKKERQYIHMNMYKKADYDDVFKSFLGLLLSLHMPRCGKRIFVIK